MQRWSPDIFSKAWNFATYYHQGQTYGGPQEGMQVDYINHVASVAVEVIWALPTLPDANAELAIQCALLHDVIEDTAASYELVLETFGQPVADGVLALTKDATLPGKPAQMADSLRRIKLQPREVWMVKLADRIANLSAPPHYWNNDKILAYRDEARLIRAELGEASVELAGRLDERIEAYPGYLR